MRSQRESRAAVFLVAALSTLALVTAVYAYAQLRQLHDQKFMVTPRADFRLMMLGDVRAFMLAVAVLFGAIVAAGRTAHLSLANTVAAVGWALAASGLLIYSLLVVPGFQSLLHFRASQRDPVIVAVLWPHSPFSALFIPLSIRFSRRGDRGPTAVVVACLIAILLAAWSNFALHSSSFS